MSNFLIHFLIFQQFHVISVLVTSRIFSFQTIQSPQSAVERTQRDWQITPRCLKLMLYTYNIASKLVDLQNGNKKLRYKFKMLPQGLGPFRGDEKGTFFLDNTGSYSTKLMTSPSLRVRGSFSYQVKALTR